MYEDVFGFRLLMGEERMRAYSVAAKQVLLLFKKGGSTQTSAMHGDAILPHDGQGTLHLAFAIGPEDRAAWEVLLSEKGLFLESTVHCGDDAAQGDSLISAIPTVIF